MLIYKGTLISVLDCVVKADWQGKIARCSHVAVEGRKAVTNKQITRETGKKARRGMRPEDRDEASRVIVQRIIQTTIFRNAETIMIYNAMPDEVDITSLSEMPEANGKIICYPHVLGKGHMKALFPSGEDDWIEGEYGIREPNPDTSKEICPEEIDLILCPCTAFDENGGRMGMGGGYYDRYLPLCRHAVIGAVAFETQKVPSVPMEEHDIRMELIFTEKAVYKS